MDKIVAIFRVFFRYRHLMVNLVKRDLKVKYRRSFLGILWSVINPLFMMLVMSIVFGYMFDGFVASNSLPDNSQTGLAPNFLVYVFSGQILFAAFSDSTTNAMDSIIGNSQLIKKVYIPKYIFPLGKVIFAFVNTVFSLIAFVIVMIFTNTPLTIWFLLIPIFLLQFSLFCLGIGLALSSLVVFYRDIKHFYTVFMLAITYLTPIFYPEAFLGENTLALAVIKINPLYWFLSTFRELTIFGNLPSIRYVVITCIWSVFSLLTGLFIFKKSQDEFILYI